MSTFEMLKCKKTGSKLVVLVDEMRMHPREK
jgi:hypothetical protein